MTLADLLVALALFALVGSLMTRVLLQAGRLAGAGRERVQAALATDAGLAFLEREWAPLGGHRAEDLVRVAGDSVTYRAVRFEGLACRVRADAVVIPPAQAYAARLPQAGRDSLLLLAGGGDPGQTRGWVSAPILGVTSDTCRGGPGLRLTTGIDTTRIFPVQAPSLTPVRVFEVMQTRLYQSQGATWLGARSVSAGEAIQPLAGPFLPAVSRFDFLDSAGAPLATPAGVRQIRLALAAPWVTTLPGSRPSPETGSLTLTPGNLQP